ncbi:hypothetical protein [Pedobacter endophyticus]|uniref:Uncharacterized protein n=1 Tax=Pedobacter endophyticus TaxID=2789740 RepID=A0A7S9L3D8_9SPHI|nr:hypothetical protein [Pedobacter endophyticus]QPH41724.1 hypothetical protein IZT61_10915 [Pedobacter endophyticus]
MKVKSANKEKISAAIHKMISDKNAVRSYLQGETSLNRLKEKGIKLAKPL